jgi:photosystem II stability/assembly factor-like uncharacterized protein
MALSAFVVCTRAAPATGALDALTTRVPSLHVSAERTSWLPAPPSAPQWGPAPEEEGLVFAPQGDGFLAAGALSSADAPGIPAEVQRTQDQGASWATVWRQAGDSLSWIGMAGASVLAAGLAEDGQRPFLLESNNNGASWRAVHISLSPTLVPGVQPGYVRQALGALWSSYQFDFVSASVGFALPDPMAGLSMGVPGQMLRTTDGGEDWAAVSLPGGQPTGGLAFPNLEEGFATGRTSRCSGQIWRSRDAGARWSAVPGTCVDYRLDALSFPSPADGFAGGGNWAKFTSSGSQRLDLMATTNGGRQWSKVYELAGRPHYQGDDNPFGEVDFISAEDGFALDGGQAGAVSGASGGHLWRSTDGGRLWAQMPVEGVRLVTAAPGEVWLVGGAQAGGDFLWRSLDGGLTWSELGNPAYTKVLGVSGSSDELWVATEAGDYLSGDGGRSWHRPPAAMERAETTWVTDVGVGVGPKGSVVVGAGWEDDALWLSDDGGRSGRTVKVAPLASTGIDAAGFSNGRDGLALDGGGCGQPVEVVATSDGGATWQRVGELNIIPLAFAYDGRLAVVAGGGCDTNGNEVDISRDGGRTWGEIPSPDQCFTASALGTTVALMCASITPFYEYMLFSTDNGEHWTMSRFAGPGDKVQPGTLIVSGLQSVWADGPPGLLWHTTNGGRSWAAVRLLLPFEA